MSSASSQILHIAVLAFPFGSHAAPLLSLVETLAENLPNARFSFFSTPSSNSALFKQPNGGRNITPYGVWDGAAEGESLQEREATMRFVATMPTNYEKAVAEAEEEIGAKFGCFLTDAFIWFGGDMAADGRGGAPWIALWTAASSTLSLHLHTDLIRSLAVAAATTNGDEEQPLKAIPGMSAIPIGDVPAEVLAENIYSSFPGMLYNMSRNIHRANAVVINSFQELEPTITNHLKSKLQKVFNIGPMTLLSSLPPQLTDEHHCIPWLDSIPTPAVYLSFGRVLALPPDEIVAIAEALEAKRVPFLWSLKQTSMNLLPDGFLDRAKDFGKVVPWAPQVQVLSHPSVGAFVTHCGWNSILEAVSFGVPVICRPFFGDQKLNSRLVESVWEIGVKVEGGIFTKNGTIKALDHVLASDRRKVFREHVGVLKERALEAVKPDEGSSTQDFQALLHLLHNYIT
ncbi:unnamed protein product [Cuscuta europaea]|uniref:Glycosyltransferase n=1 Tax=Cuscuta europaea TaxID=41803 RepID=A0A9P0ZWM8_CUSEU|nr:unnamed protein product [Cuscuta europaea]